MKTLADVRRDIYGYYREALLNELQSHKALNHKKDAIGTRFMAEYVNSEEKQSEDLMGLGVVREALVNALKRCDVTKCMSHKIIDSIETMVLVKLFAQRNRDFFEV